MRPEEKAGGLPLCPGRKQLLSVRKEKPEGGWGGMRAVVFPLLLDFEPKLS